ASPASSRPFVNGRDSLARRLPPARSRAVAGARRRGVGSADRSRSRIADRPWSRSCGAAALWTVRGERLAFQESTSTS
ncbi:hypothetical protein, partial [Halorubrum sp. CBA1125]|uniref:hypothetical protein n=1 Tax=Halorubrum sp. CBA1125 TaxID=2668072 RepID=UPI001E59149B